MHTVVLDDQHRTPEAAAFVCQPCGMHLARWGATATLHTITDQCHAGTCRARQHLPELERDAG